MLPATKAISEEMLPLVDKPLIQYVVNECIAARFTQIVLVTHESKAAIKNHLDTSYEFESTLVTRVKSQLLEEVRIICPQELTTLSLCQGVVK
jgi:UTP--glucose-1-phosphate uridylyltransferase